MLQLLFSSNRPKFVKFISESYFSLLPEFTVSYNGDAVVYIWISVNLSSSTSKPALESFGHLGSITGSQTTTRQNNVIGLLLHLRKKIGLSFLVIAINVTLLSHHSPENDLNLKRNN